MLTVLLIFFSSDEKINYSNAIYDRTRLRSPLVLHSSEHLRHFHWLIAHSSFGRKRISLQQPQQEMEIFRLRFRSSQIGRDEEIYSP